DIDKRIVVPAVFRTSVGKRTTGDSTGAYLNETHLFSNQWRYRRGTGENAEECKTRFRAALREVLDKARASGVVVPQVVYGYFAANGEGNDVGVWKDDTGTAERVRFASPRQGPAALLCIADFFRPVASGEAHYAA